MATSSVENHESTKRDGKFGILESNKNTSVDVYRNFQSLYAVKALPYIPIPFEEIKAYIKLPDYTKDRIKNINTVGRLYSIDFSCMILYSTQEKENQPIILDIKGLYDHDNFLGPGSNPKKLQLKAVRVFGTLQTQKKRILIRVHHFSRVKNVECTERTLRIMAQVARQKISAYHYDLSTNPEIQYLISQTEKEELAERELKRLEELSELSDEEEME